MYITSASYGVSLEYVKKVTEESAYGWVSRKTGRGQYALFSVQEHPMYAGQHEFKLSPKDRIIPAAKQ